MRLAKPLRDCRKCRQKDCNMQIETYICISQNYNHFIRGHECYSLDGILFYIDQKGYVKVGDEVKCERRIDGWYDRIWVNGILIQ